MVRVVFCAAEVAPFAKVGGLGDVVGSLPKALAKIGVSSTVVMPRYGCIDPQEAQLEATDYHFDVHMPAGPEHVEVWKTRLPGSEVPLYLLENARYFAARTEIYPYDRMQWEAEGYLLLGKALFELLPLLGQQPPDILHLHDWHTAYVVTELGEVQERHPFYRNTRSVLTLHNLAYQGGMSNINWLREGIRMADMVTTVSPTYAKEIKTPPNGFGLEPELIRRGDHLVGILNGIDETFFNPQTDPFIPERYTSQNATIGKGICKEAIQLELGLPLAPDIPLIGMVTRLVEQKGLDLMLPIMDQLLTLPAQWVILGSGEAKYEEAFLKLNSQTDHFRCYVGYHTALAQKIYAGSDIFLMPSRFEPCGLGQMIALRYGSVPVVRSTGGLVDTVCDIRDDNYEFGTGFRFEAYEPAALLSELAQAISYYGDETTWRHLIKNGMAEDFSWEQSAKAYKDVYLRALKGVAAGERRHG
jgi:starch synthase